ncbi:MAG: hypothetical protein IPO71_02490 [Nitrosomonas sp.]|nr:hypothetical protein [Nitrosomonas sp.]
MLPSALLLFSFSHPVLAVVFGKVLQPYASYGLTADDNILRIRDKQSLPAPEDNPVLFNAMTRGNLFDFSHRLTGGLIFEKEISRQRLSANFNWTHNRYEKFDFMNNNLKSANGNWNWFLGNRLEGNMGASYIQSLMPLTFQPGLRAIRTEQIQFINGAWHFHPSWRLNGEYTHYDLNVNSSVEVMRFLARTEDRFEGGIDYVTASKNTIGILFRNVLGNFTNPPRQSSNFDYDQKEVLTKINWIVSAKSRFLWTGGWVERKNDGNNSLTGGHSLKRAQLDFSGFNARLAYTWQPTDKLGLTINGWRQTGSPQNLTASFSLNTGVSVIPSWNITEKIRFEGDLSYETRNFKRLNPSNPESELLGQHNTFRNAAVKLIYSPYLGLQLSATAYHSDLNSDAVRGGFNANGVNVNLQYIYGKR